MMNPVCPKTAKAFEEVYARSAWGNGSGVGSTPINNVKYISFLSRFMHQNRIRSVVDFGCGDWQFSQLIDWSGVAYTGIDLVESIIYRNKAQFARPGIEFLSLRDTRELPPADLLICKDVFQHLPNSFIVHYLDAFQSKYKFMLITNDNWPAEDLNCDISPGGWRSLRLELDPFNCRAAIVLSWPVLTGSFPTHKATYLLSGSQASQ